jgi:hypothetical protein
MKIFPKGNYLNKEQAQEFLDLWSNQAVITSGIKSKIFKSEVFKDKFQVSEKELKEFYSNEIFK